MYSFVHVKVERGAMHRELRASLDHLRRKARCGYARFCLTRDVGGYTACPAWFATFATSAVMIRVNCFGLFFLQEDAC